MRKLLILVSLFPLLFQSNAQKLDWVAELRTGDNAYENVSLSISDGANGAYLWATTNDEFQFSSATGAVENLQSSEDGSRGFNIIRLNASGEKIFSEYVDVSVGDDNGFLDVKSLEIDNGGNLYILGRIGSSTTITIGETQVSVDQEANIFRHSIILKIDPNGDLVSHLLLQKEKEFVHHFLSADFFEDKLYVLYGLIDSTIDPNGAEYLFTHHIDVFDHQWNIVGQKSFSGKSRNTGGNAEERKQFLMSKIEVHNENQIYLSGVIQNGLGSDLSSDIITDNPAMVNALVQLDANLDFVWFRGVQGYLTNFTNTGLVVFPNGDIAINSRVYSYSSYPTSLIGSGIQKTELPGQLENSTRQLFFTNGGEFKFQTLIEASVTGDEFYLIGDNIYYPFSLNSKDQINFYYEESQIELQPSRENWEYNYGYIKINQFGRYQSHRFYELAGQTGVSDMQIIPRSDCNSFIFLGRYGGDSESSINPDFQGGATDILTNGNNTDNVFIASYSNQTPGLQIDEDQVYRSGSTISIPVSITDDSMADVTFFASSSNESIISTDNYRLVNDNLGSRLVFEQTEGASGSVDLQLQLVDQCESTDETSLTLNLEDVNDVPVFESEPVTTVDDNNEYNYSILVSDPDDGIVEVKSVLGLPDWLSLTPPSQHVGEIFTGKTLEGSDDGSLQEATFSFPTDIVEDSHGSFFVTDSGLNGSVRKITSDGQVVTFVGRNDGTNPDGIGTEAGIDEPSAIAIDSQDNLYVTEWSGKKVRKITPEGIVTTLATFSEPLDGIAINSLDEVFVASASQGIIYRIDQDGNISQFAGGGSGDGEGSSAGFNEPTSLVFDDFNNLYVGERLANGIRKITPDGFVTTPIQFGDQRVINGIEVDSRGNFYLGSGSTVFRYFPDGNFDVFAKFALDAHGVYLNSKQELLIANFSKHQIQKAYVIGEYKLQGTANPSDGLVDVTLQANDGNGGVATQSFQIKVDNQAPVFTSPENVERGESPTIGAAYSVGVQDASEVSYSLGIGHDEAFFNMDGQYSNVVYYNQPRDFENPHDADGDNIYVFEVIATDKGGNSSSLLVNLTVENVNESGPVISTSTELTIVENTKDITQIEATGFEDGFEVSYSKSGGADLDAFFMTTDGELSFRNAPDFEFPTDANKDNVYEIEITARVGDRIDTKLFFVMVNDVPESLAPVFISEPVISVAEGDEYSYPILTSDPDNDELEITLLKAPDWLVLNSDQIQVSTFAGSGNGGFLEGQRLLAEFNRPADIIIDDQNQLYILEEEGARIRKIDQRGEVTTLAGTGGFGAINGDGSQATFKFPKGLAIDNAGNLYVADAGNYLIRKVTPDGVVSTFAGSGNFSFSDGIGTQASFKFPTGIAIDASGNLFVADQSDHRIRKITPEGVVSVFAGSGTDGLRDGLGVNAEFFGPSDLVFDSQGNLYVTDFYNSRIRKITPEGAVSTIAGNNTSAISDGQGESASFHSPRAISIDENDILYVSDRHVIRKITPQGEVTTLAGTNSGSFKDGIVPQVQFSSPNGLIVDPNGNLYIADQHNNRIRKISQTAELTGTPVGVFGDFEIELKVSDGEDGENIQAFTLAVLDVEAPVFTSVDAVTINEDQEGLIYEIVASDASSFDYSLEECCDADFFRIVDNQLLLNEPLDFEGKLDFNADNIYNIYIKATDAYGNFSTLNLKVTLDDVEEEPVFTSEPITQINDNEVYSYEAFVINPNMGPLNITANELPEWLNAEPIYEVSTLAGKRSPFFKDGAKNEAIFSQPRGIAFDAQGNLYLADALNNMIRKISADGVVSTFAGSGYSELKDGNGEEAGFNFPQDIVFDQSGNLIVADSKNHAIRKISPQGEVTTISGNGDAGFTDGPANSMFNYPLDVGVDSQGNIFINDSGNFRIRKIDGSGNVTTFAGNGFAQSLDGVGENASFLNMNGLAIDSEDNVYVGQSDGVIRKISKQAEVSIFAGNGTPGYQDGVGTNAQLSGVTGLTFGGDGFLYFSDANNYRIRKVSPSGEVSTIMGSGGYGIADGEALLAKSTGARDLTFNASGELFFVDGARIVRKLNTSNIVEYYAGQLSPNEQVADGRGDQAVLYYPRKSATDSYGNLYITDLNQLRKIDPSGKVTSLGQYGSPYDIIIDNDDNIYYTDFAGNRVMGLFSNSQPYIVAGGQFGSVDGVGNQAGFGSPYGLVKDSQGNIIVADYRGNSIRKITPDRVVTTYTGSTEGFKNGSLEEALFYGPRALAIDQDDNIYVSDYRNRVIRKISTSGEVTTFAGSGDSGHDDGSASEASFTAVEGITLDDVGNLWVIDANFVRRISPNGFVTTMGGSSTSGHKDGPLESSKFVQAVGIHFSNGSFYVTDGSGHTLRVISPVGLKLSGDPKGKGGIHEVSIVATDIYDGEAVQDFTIEVKDIPNPKITSSSQVNVEENSTMAYLAEAIGGDAIEFSLGAQLDESLFEINNLTGQITFKNTPNFENPQSSNQNNTYRIKVIANQEIYSDELEVEILVINLNDELPVFNTNPITRVNDDSKYSYTAFGSDPDASSTSIEAVSIPSWLNLTSETRGEVSTIAGSFASSIQNGTGLEAAFNRPNGITTDISGNIYMADKDHHRIVKITPVGEVTTFAGTGNSGYKDGPALEAQFNLPWDIAFDSQGNLYVTDAGNFRLRKIDTQGKVTTLAGSGESVNKDGLGINASFKRVSGITIDAADNIYVLGTRKVRRVALDGNVITYAGQESLGSDNGIGEEASFGALSGLTNDDAGNLYVSDIAFNNIRKIDVNQQVTNFVGSGNFGFTDGAGEEASFATVDGLTFGNDGFIYATDRSNGSIRKISLDGTVTTFAGTGNVGLADGSVLNAEFTRPSGLTFDNQGNLYVTQLTIGNIRMISSDLVVSTFAGGGAPSYRDGISNEATFYQPWDVAVNKSGDIYVADLSNHAIRKVDSNGNVTTLAGTGQSGYTNGSGQQSQFNSPTGLDVDNEGNLYVADFANHVIRKITSTGEVSTIAGTGVSGYTDGPSSQAQFFNPSDVVVAQDGSLFVTDRGNGRIRKISNEGVVTTLAGDGGNISQDGQGMNATILNPEGITIDDLGNLYVVEDGNLVRKINSNGDVSTLAGSSGGYQNGEGADAKFNLPYGIAVDKNQNIYVADLLNHAIRMIDPSGLVTTLSGSTYPVFNEGVGELASFNKPAGVAIDNDGNLIIADSENHRVRKVSIGNSILKGSAVGQTGIHTVSLKITDASGASSLQEFDIQVIDVTKPTITSLSESVFEVSQSGPAYTVSATDSNPITYSLGTSYDESLFNIEQESGKVHFKTPPDFSNPKDSKRKNEYKIEVRATDLAGNSSSKEILLKVIDETPPQITLISSSKGIIFSTSVTVNFKTSEIVDGLSIQSFTTSNATISDLQGNGLEYSFILTSLADGPASVKMLENKVFDAAQNGNKASNVLNFNFEARNVAPTGITLSASAVSENIVERVEVALLGAEDGDEADQHTFRLVSGDGDSDNAKFNIIGNKLYKRNEVSLNFETQPTLSVRIQVSDIRGGSFTAVKTINVTNIPEPSMSLKVVDATERELEVAGINFGRVKVGASQVRQMEVLNTSADAELQVTDIKVSSGFTVSESILTLGIAEKKVLNVTYLPQEPGVHLGKLELVTNAGNQSLSVAGSAFANKKPIAIAPEARISHIPGNVLKLIGFDPDGDEIEFVITANPALGSLVAQSGLGEYKFVPSALAPETVYEDELKFKVVEKNGGLSSDEATLKFRFRIRDVKHTLLPTEIVSVDGDNISIVISFTDEVINNDYFLTGFYRGKEEGQTVFFGNNLKISKGDLINTNGVLSAKVAVSRNEFPALFTNTKLLLAVKLKTANGFESSNTRIFTRSNEGQLNGNAVSDGSTDDGDFSVFALDSTVPENESVNISISAVEFGDFDFSGASLQITKSPANGTLGQPVLVSNQNGLAQWTVSYTSTTEIGIEDSFEFSVVHPARNKTLTGNAKIEVIGVPDAPILSAIADQQVNEDETLSFSINASDVDSELSYSVISSESDISGIVSDGKLNITATNNFNGSAVIQLVISEVNETSPQSVSQSFNLIVLAINDAPIVTSVSDQLVNEDGEISVTLAATDPDGDTGAFSYSVSSDSDANVSYLIENGSLKLKPAADFNGVVNFTVKANDGSGTATAISAGENFKLTIVPVNDVPEVSKSLSTQTLIEGFASYSLDLSKYFSDKETTSSELEYSISNLTNVATSINGKLLVISSVSGNTGLQTAIITASDGGLSVSQQITFVTSAPSSDVTIANAITDLNLAEDFGLRTVDLSSVFVYSLNANASFTYSLAGNQNVDALVKGNTLEINSTENFNGSDMIYITATVDGKSNLTSFKINISPVNDAPTLVAALSDESVLEDAAFTKAISSSSFADIDGDALSYTASYNAAWLSFDAVNRTFSGTPGNGDVGTVEVTVTAEDPSGAKATDVFQIIVSNTNDNPTNIGISASAIDENIGVGTTVASLSGTDPDVGDTNFTYSLVSGTGDTDNASFEIVDGQLKTLASVNYESKASYSIRVKITDGFEGTFEKVFTITVNNLNEVATDITLATTSIAENQSVGAVIDGFATVDPDQGDTYTYSLVAGTGDTDNASFDIVGGQLVSNAEFNFEAKSSYSVRVKSTDAGGLSFEKVFAITVTDANDAPTTVTSTTLELAENSAIGTVIGEFSSTDEDTGDAHSYSLVSGTGDADNANFEFDGANLKAKASFNFEIKSSYSIRVQSSDGNGGTIQSQFTVNISNVLEVELRTESSVTVPTTGVDFSETVELVLNNEGEDVLEITNISFPEGFSGSFTNKNIAGGSNETLIITFEPKTEGIFEGNIVITSNAGTNLVSIRGEAEIVTGVEEPTILQSQVKLYPNPASLFIEIDLSDLNGIPADLSIKSINGTSMWNLNNVNQSKVLLDISTYSDGAYLILVQTEKGTITKRLLVKK